jgi:hypothetical protein
MSLLKRTFGIFADLTKDIPKGQRPPSGLFEIFERQLNRLEAQSIVVSMLNTRPLLFLFLPCHSSRGLEENETDTTLYSSLATMPGMDKKPSPAGLRPLSPPADNQYCQPYPKPSPRPQKLATVSNRICMHSPWQRLVRAPLPW